MGITVPPAPKGSPEWLISLLAEGHRAGGRCRKFLTARPGDPLVTNLLTSLSIFHMSDTTLVLLCMLSTCMSLSPSQEEAGALRGSACDQGAASCPRAVPLQTSLTYHTPHPASEPMLLTQMGTILKMPATRLISNSLNPHL